MPTKSIFVSKTFLLNVVALLIAVLSATYSQPIPHAAEGLAVLNVLLRFLTVGAVSLFGAEK